MARGRTFLRRLSVAESTYIADALRQETVGGALLLVAAFVALCWANSPWHEAYESICQQVIGPSSPLHLNLSVEEWTADGLLTIFFFVAGLELKRELVVGELRKPVDAILPVAAALAGMATPAAIYFAVTRGNADTSDGWAIPIATDIAFALAILAVIGSALPAALRAFLLTLAVVDDLGAITVIAVFYTETIEWKALSTAAVGLALWWFLQHRRVHVWWAYLPLAFFIWAFVHESGIHATVAGVAMGLLTRVRPDPGEAHPPVEQLEHRVRPWSAGVAVPAFAFCAAGVRVVGSDLGAIVDDPVVPAIVLALCLGKALGVFGGTYVVARFTRAELSSDLEWGDVFGVATLSGVGFTVSLLIGELAFDDPTRVDHAKIAVLVGSLLSAGLASVLLRRRNKAYANS
jgi:NhaA family Na+:H+ antiporter